MAQYVIGLDQSTQGTKALLVDSHGNLVARCDRPHKQIINDQGWVEHDPLEILSNVCSVIKDLLAKSEVDAQALLGVGISNQRETGMVWHRKTGKPIYNAIVWQCARGKAICDDLQERGFATMVKEHTGLTLSPYFTAAKIAWVIKHVPGADELNRTGELCFGTMDSWLIYRLTGGLVYKTDYSNASRTQLFDIRHLKWDEDICKLFGLNIANLPQVSFSDDEFGETDFNGVLEQPIPIRAVMGDSHGALYAQGCHGCGMVKSTYGTGSSVMMNIGAKPVLSQDIVTSLAWGIKGKIDYVLEGNINYSAAVITWLKDDLKLIASSMESARLAQLSNVNDTSYLVPAFSGLGAPYWASGAKAALMGMTRSTGINEVVRAALDSIAYQIHDVLECMERDSGIHIGQLRADGGPTCNDYLMQFQSDIICRDVLVSNTEELSGIGAAYLAGISIGLLDEKEVFSNKNLTSYRPHMGEDIRKQKLAGWNAALKMVLGGR